MDSRVWYARTSICNMNYNSNSIVNSYLNGETEPAPLYDSIKLLPLNKQMFIKILNDIKKEVIYESQKINDDFLSLKNIDNLQIGDRIYNTRVNLLEIEGILKYKAIISFIFETGIRINDLILFTNNDFVDIIRQTKCIKIYNKFYPLYTNELNLLIFSLSKLFCNKIKLYNMKQIRRFFDVGYFYLYEWLVYIFYTFGYSFPQSFGFHTIRYVYMEKSKYNPYKINKEYKILDIELFN